MELKQAAAAVAAGIMTLATTAAVFAEAPQSSDYDVLSLPVQILDFDKDNLIFEYTLYKGLDFVDTANPVYDSDAVDADGSPIGVPYAPGLVETPLADTLTYRPEQVERIAKLAGKALAADDHPDTELYQTLRGKILLPGEANRVTNESLLGDDKDNTILNNWTSTDAGEDTACKWYDGILYRLPANLANTNPTLWYFATDHLHLLDSRVQLQRTFPVESGQEYVVSWYEKNDDNIKVHVNAGAFDQDITEQNTTVEIPADATALTITVSCAQNGDYDLTALYFNKKGDEQGKVFSDANDRAEQKLWTSSIDGTTVKTALMNDRFCGYIGDTLWNRETDGIRCTADSSIISTPISVNPSSILTVDFWGEGTPTLCVYDANTNELIGDFTTPKQSDWSHPSFQTSDATSKIKIEIVGKPGDRVANMTVTSSQSVRVGSLAGARSFDSQQAMLDEENLTAAEYVNYMLTHLFTPTKGLNTADTRYDNLILRRQDDGSYLFDSEQPIVYDTASRMLYNDAERGEDRKGFFPVDGLPGGETTTSEENGDHNYHFTLHSGGQFVYKADKNLYFDFSGDDDVYLFINKNLALDLGGAHKKASKRIDLNEKAAELGLTDGQTYNFDFFYMERHTDASNLRIRTNIDVQRRIDNSGAKVVQNIQFDLKDVDTPPQELYVQVYLDGKPYDSPMKFTPDEPARRLELEGGHDYTCKLLTDTDEYELTIFGDTLVQADVNNVEKTLIYTLRKKGTAPAPAVTPTPDSSDSTPAADTAPAPTAQPAAAPAAAKAVVTAAAAVGTIPQTADADHPVLLGILCVVGAFGFGVVYVKRRKKF